MPFSLGYLIWGYRNSPKGDKLLRGVHNILGYMGWGYQISWDDKYPVTPVLLCFATANAEVFCTLCFKFIVTRHLFVVPDAFATYLLAWSPIVDKQNPGFSSSLESMGLHDTSSCFLILYGVNPLPYTSSTS